MKSTLPPASSERADVAAFEQEIRENGETDARRANLARLMSPEEPPPSSGARRDSA